MKRAVHPVSRRRETLRVLRLAAVAFLLALLVHAVVGYQFRDDPFSRTHVSDAQSYHEWAAGIAARGLGPQPVFHQSPLFPLVLAAVYDLGGEAWRQSGALLLQVVLTSLAIALIVPLGKLYLGSEAAGFAGSVLALLHAPIVFHSMTLLPVPLTIATQAAGLVALGWARRRGGAARAALAGAAWGLACLARAEMVLFLPLGALATVVALPDVGIRRRRGWLAAGAFLAGAACLIAPATLHNLRRGDAVLIASAGGENLFAGNRRGADGGHTPIHSQAADLFSQRALARRLAERDRGRPLRPSEISSYWRGRALREIAADPAAWLGLELRKLGLLFHPGDPSDIRSLPLERRLYLPALYALPLAPWGLWLLGGAGAVLVVRRRPRAGWPLLALVALHVFVLLLFFVSTRLRLPSMFLLTPLGGLALVEGWSAWRAGRRRGLGIALAAAVLAAAVHWTWLVRPAPGDALRLAAVLSRQGETARSLEVLQPWIARPAPDPLILDEAGWVHSKRGDLRTARALYERALAAGIPAAREPQTRSRLANVLERLGDLEAAAEQHDLAVGAGPDSAGARYERARFRLRRGDRAGAVLDLREAVRLAPQWPPPRRALARLKPDTAGRRPR